MVVKSLRQIVTDNPSVPYYRSDRDKEFAGKHKVLKTDDAAGNKDSLFKGVTKPAPRPGNGASPESSPKDSYGAGNIVDVTKTKNRVVPEGIEINELYGKGSLEKIAKHHEDEHKLAQRGMDTFKSKAARSYMAKKANYHNAQADRAEDLTNVRNARKELKHAKASLSTWTKYAKASKIAAKSFSKPTTEEVVTENKLDRPVIKLKAKATTYHRHNDGGGHWQVDSKTYHYHGHNRKAAITWALNKLQNQYPSHKEHSVEINDAHRISQMSDDQVLQEVISADASSAAWIKDFVHSNNKKFEGKSKKERIRMALGAYYSHHKEEYVLEARQPWNVVHEPYSLEKGKVGQKTGERFETPFSTKRKAESHLYQKIKGGKTGPGYHYILSPKGETLSYNASKKHRVKGVKEETIEEGISNPNSSGQGYDDTHMHHPLHRTLMLKGYGYSHSTPVHALDGTVHIHHTYKFRDHNIGVYAHDGSKWEGHHGGSGRHVRGLGPKTLNKYLNGAKKHAKDKSAKRLAMLAKY